MSPSSPASSSRLTARTGGLYVKVCPHISTRPEPRAIPARRSASIADAASGFSTNVCLPASSAASASPAWVPTGVTIRIASSSGSSSRSSYRSVGMTLG